MPGSTLFLTGIIWLSVDSIAGSDGPTTKNSVSRVVEGRVVDEHGAPIAGALVMLGPALDFPQTTEEGQTRTDREGRYHITLTDASDAASELGSMVLAAGFA